MPAEELTKLEGLVKKVIIGEDPAVAKAEANREQEKKQLAEMEKDKAAPPPVKKNAL